jgi:translation initiation factor 6 (eIF-6)
MDKEKYIANPYGDKINTSENYEMEYWSNKFGVSVERLKSAVKAVGNSVVLVEAHLK